VASRDVDTHEQKYSDKWPPTQLTGTQTPGVYTLRLTPAYMKFEQFRIEFMKPVLLHRLPSTVHLIFLKTPRLLGMYIDTLCTLNLSDVTRSSKLQLCL